MTKQEFRACLQLYASDWIFGADPNDCPEADYRSWPRVSEDTGAIQLIEDGPWYGGLDMDLPYPPNCGFCGKTLKYGEWYTCAGCLILEQPSQPQ